MHNNILSPNLFAASKHIVLNPQFNHAWDKRTEHPLSRPSPRAPGDSMIQAKHFSSSTLLGVSPQHNRAVADIIQDRLAMVGVRQSGKHSQTFRPFSRGRLQAGNQANT